MKVALTVNDFLRRAELVYGDRIGLVDEPDQPAPSWGEMTWAQVADRARAQAAGLDALGLAPGERVAVVSQNSARLFTSFFGVSGSGRILVPINFRLAPPEVEYIVEHSGARVLIVDPELDGAMPNRATCTQLPLWLSTPGLLALSTRCARRYVVAQTPMVFSSPLVRAAFGTWMAMLWTLYPAT